MPFVPTASKPVTEVTTSSLSDMTGMSSWSHYVTDGLVLWEGLGRTVNASQCVTRGVHRTHTPRGMSTGTVQLQSTTQRDISADAHRTGAISRILCSCMAISKAWE